jgi:hypothetical protein
MSPEQVEINRLREEVRALTRKVNELNEFMDVYQRTYFIDKVVINKPLFVSSDATFGGNKIAFYGKTPSTQPAAITPPSGGATVDSQARASIASIIAVLNTLGLTA